MTTGLFALLCAAGVPNWEKLRSGLFKEVQPFSLDGKNGLAGFNDSANLSRVKIPWIATLFHTQGRSNSGRLSRRRGIMPQRVPTDRRR
jgi:hypothetical protein